MSSVVLRDRIPITRTQSGETLLSRKRAELDLAGIAKGSSSNTAAKINVETGHSPGRQHSRSLGGLQNTTLDKTLGLNLSQSGVAVAVGHGRGGEHCACNANHSDESFLWFLPFA